MIVVCEPACEGYENVEFNAALLASVRQAFGEPLLFLAEPAHIGLVAQRVAAAGLGGVAFRPLAIRARSTGIASLLAEVRRVREVLGLARARDARAVLFSSTGAAGLFALKLLAGSPNPPCLVVPHGILETLGSPSGDRWFPRVLRMRNPVGLRYLVLSSSIEREVLREVPSLAGATSAAQHPYLFAEPAHCVPEAPPIRFGSLGTAARGRGLAALVELARDTLRTRPGKAAFVHIGPVRELALVEEARDAVVFPSRGYLPREEYEREIANIDYALFLNPSDSCRFTVSGAFLDAVSLLKPVIALRSSYFEHCFEQLGDIGYLCDTPEQVHELARQLCSRFPKAHYQAQREAMRAGREIFAPTAVGASLRAAFALWEAREAA
ncbi:MAG: hypothetical protein HY901_10260 [Deltaproteobacteria bacterium]|nr:hypothetical protein [Deltaproteobacteria bacterium]